MNNFLFIGAISGFLTVAIGAFGAHGLKPQLTEYAYQIFQTGVLYQAIHSLALVTVGILQRLKVPNLMLSGWSFILGILLFSGSLYLMAITGIKWLGAITPIGGTAFLIGWLLLALRVRKQ